ncbi:hypothetical protein K2D_20070 [Planctomycetes bacterium K2D]|nr:hypothetical protein K2D_20070 [Planctomycetes bacterium K2D]
MILREVEEAERDDLRRTVVDALDAHEDVTGFESEEGWIGLLDANDERFLWDLDFENDDLSDLPLEHSSHTRRALHFSRFLLTLGDAEAYSRLVDDSRSGAIAKPVCQACGGPYPAINAQSPPRKKA